MKQVTSVLIVGVGGQGTLLASRLLGNAMLSAGCDVKVSEVHGMSQRGGSVVTYVRYGEEVASPIIEEGGADYILAFEQLEAARFLPWLKNGGEIIANSQTIDPMPVITGAAHYPQDLIQKNPRTGRNHHRCRRAFPRRGSRFFQGGKRGAHRRARQTHAPSLRSMGKNHPGNRSSKIC